MSRSNFKRHLVLAAAVVTMLSLRSATSLAQTAAPGVPVSTSSADIETSKYSFFGEVNADDTLVRSGPTENDYQVLKLKKGTKLTVVGMRYDWLKIVPPDGAFCLVAEAFIDKAGDGSTGHVINKGASVRVGSALTQAMYKVLPKQLEPGETVKILGETPTSEFYKIAPPKDVFMYVDKKFVNPVRRTDGDSAIGTVAGAQSPVDPAPAAVATGAPDSSTTVQPDPGVASATPDGASATEKNFTVHSVTSDDSAAAVANQEQNATAIRALQEKLSKLEDRYAAAGQLELSQQPLDDLSKDYDALIADKQLPPNARKVAEYRSSQLKLRKQAVVEFAAAKKAQEDAAAKQRDLKAEQDELAARVAATQVKHYAAVGRLMQSSLQVGGQTLYRLVDPANGRLILYVRQGKLPIGDKVQQFIAINGQVVRDDAVNLTYVTPEATDVADPKLLNTKIFADYAPPSMATSNVGGEASAR